jgi:hypothetical protein
MAAMPGSLVPLVSMTGSQLGMSAHQQMLNSSLLVRNLIQNIEPILQSYFGVEILTIF